MAIKCGNIVVGDSAEEPKAPQPIVIQGVTKETLRERLEEIRNNSNETTAVPVEQNDDKKVSQYMLDMYNSNEVFSFDKYLEGKPI